MKKLISLTIIIFFLISSFLSASTKYQSKTILSFDETPIFFQHSGAGDISIVFIHGWSCDGSYWENQMDYFGKQYRVVAVDLAGHGSSGTERKDYTIQSFALDVKAVVENLNLEKVILVGHSMGGAVILEAAKLLGNKVVCLVGADTYQNFTEKFPEDLRNKFVDEFKINFVEHTKDFVKKMFPESADSAIVETISKDMSSAPSEVAISAMKNLFDYDPIETLKNIDAPIVSINSDFWPTNVEANRTAAKNFRLKIMGNVGHFVMIEDPETFNSLLSETIDNVLNN